MLHLQRHAGSQADLYCVLIHQADLAGLTDYLGEVPFGTEARVQGTMVRLAQMGELPDYLHTSNNIYQ